MTMNDLFLIPLIQVYVLQNRRNWGREIDQNSVRLF